MFGDSFFSTAVGFKVCRYLCTFLPVISLEGERLTHQEFWLLNFAGARGAVSIALILLLPDSFELKETFLSIAFVMILFSLVIYPLVIQQLQRRINSFTEIT
ncbi:MAG: hypothetical protein GY927_01980 [bacterium]|nr:hypothetical protein [bacterium]